MAGRLKVYHEHDGTYRLMTAARNLKEAALLLNTTTGGIRRYGGVFTDAKTVAVALSAPGQVWRRRLDAVKDAPWVLRGW